MGSPPDLRFYVAARPHIMRLDVMAKLGVTLASLRDLFELRQVGILVASVGEYCRLKLFWRHFVATVT
jgi:hypothetical protein